MTHPFRAASQDANYTSVGRFTTKPYHLFLKKGGIGVHTYLNKFLHTLRASGEYARLYPKWFAPDSGDGVR